MKVFTGCQPVKSNSLKKATLFNHWLSVFVVFLMTGSLSFFGNAAQAQNLANYAFSTNTSASLEDMTVSTEVVAGVQDSYASTVLPIGFDFYFMGQIYSHFNFTSNGLIRLHTSESGTAITGTTYTNTAGVVTIAPFAGDNKVNNGMRYKVVGTAPNRKLILEFTGFTVYWTPNVLNAGNMQAWLHEGTGVIDFVYGEIYNASSSTQTRSILISSGNTATTVGSVTIAATPTFTTGSATPISNTIAGGSGTSTGSPLIEHIGSSAQGSRRIFTWTPPAGPTAPSGLNFTAVTASTMTLNWTDNSATEAGFLVQYSIDGGTTWVTAGTVAANVVTYNATGLIPATNYDWRVSAFAEISGNATTASQATNAAPVYTWDGSEGTVFGNADNWTPARTSPSNVDILVFDGTTSIVTAVTTQTIGQLRVINNATVTASSTASATLTLSGNSGDDLDIQTGSSINFGGTSAMGIAFATGSHTANISGTLQTSTTGTFTLNTTNSVMNVYGTLTLGAGSNTNTGAIGTRVFHPNAVCNINTNNINIPTATWDATATLNINGVVAATSPTITSGQSFGNINWNSTGQTGTFNLFSTSAYTIQGTLTVNSTGTGKLRLSTSSTLTLNNIVVNGGTFELMNGAGNYTIGGNITQGGGSFDWNFASSSGTVNLAGNVTRTAGTMIKTGTTTGHFLVLNGTSAQTIDIPTTVVQSYRLNNTAGLNVTGTLNINNNCTLDMRAGNILSGAVTYGATGTTLSYTGTTSQSATATEFPATAGPFNLTINNTGTAPDNTVTIPFDRSIGGTSSGTVLNLTSGVLDNIGYTLTVLNTNTTAVTTVTSGTRYVTGRLARVLPASLTGTSTYGFPVGKTTNNAFELINPTTNAGGTVTIVAEAFDGATGGNAGNSLSAISSDRYWSASISDGAVNFTDTRIRLNDTRGSFDVIGGSATLTGDYELVGGFPATLTATSIASVAPAVSSLGYYVMASPATPEISDITIDPATTQCTNVARTITATVVQGGASLTLVEIRYQVNGGSVQNVAMTNTSGDTWEGVIPTVTPANGTVTWSIFAQDAAALSKSVAGPTYKDEPLFGAVATATANPSTICSGEDVNLSVSYTGVPVAGQIGTGAGTSSLSGISPYYHGYGGAKTQYIITAAELSAAGMVAGNISSVSFEISSLGTSTLNGFAISMGHTAQTAAVTNTPITSGLTQVYSAASQTLTTGVNNYVFTTPFTWDGTSNIVVSVCYSNNNSGGSSSTVRTDVGSFTSSMAVYADNATSTAVCAATSSTGLGTLSSNTTSSTRPKMVFTGTAVPPLNTIEWNDGTNPVGSGTSIVVNPTSNTSYTAVATFTSNGCTLTSNAVAVTVNPLPAEPTSAVGSTQCGLGTPNAFVTGGLPGQFRWYLEATGGTAIPGEENQQLDSYTISTTTTFYVAIFDGNCESTRVPVTATVNTPDAVDATVVSNNVCVGSSFDLTAVQTGSNQTYTYTWTASPEAGSGITGSESGEVVNITPTVAGTYTYTVTAVDGACTTTSDVVVTVLDLPNITSATATPATICNGGSSTLTALSQSTVPATATLGTGTINNLASSTGAAGYPAPFGNYYEGAKNQFLILASELTSAGLSAGNISSLAFDVVTPQVEPLKNFTIGVKHSSLTALSTIETGFTNVYSNVAYAPSASGGYSNNTITFDTPFNWDGTSNIVIEVCFNNTFGDGGYSEYSTNAVFNQSTTAFVSSLVYRTDDFLGLCGSTSISYSYSQRPNMRLAGSTTTDLTAGLTWEWNPGALSGNSVSVSPTATETYTVTATDANGCVNTEEVEVTVNELPDAPIGTDSEHCGTLVPTAFVSTGGANGNGVFSWYDAPTGGNLLQTGTDIYYLTPISTTTTFYVSETGTNGCESERTPVNVTVIEADPLSLTATPVTSACVDAEITLEVTQDGGNNTYEFTYSADPDAGSGITGMETGTLVSVTPTAAGTYTYTVTGIDNDKGCTNVATAIITVNPLPQITAASATPSTVCSGGDVQLSAVSIPASVGDAQVGAGASTSSSSATPFYGVWGGTKVSYIYTAAELSATGMVAGNINSLSLDVSSSASTIFKGFAIGIGTTTESVFATASHLPTTNVYNGPLTDNGYQTTAGINTFVFSSPFYWDGTSNIVVSFCYSNTNTSNSASTIRTDTYTGQNKAVYSNADNKTPAQVCAAVTGSVDGSGNTYTSTLRAKTIFNGQVGVNLTSSLTWEWNPGAESGATVTVNPTTTTTYTVSATDANGCTATEDVEVTALELPATPTATPSTQCGEGVPTASVSGGSGTFLWYDAATGGNLVQTGGSTYAGSLNTSTTFYVSESDGTCESERVAVEITVNAPDPITAIAADNSICIGEDVELSVSQDGSNQNYTYTWTVSPEAGSGITGSLTGGAQTITPTAAGTYVYQVAGFDAVGPCNISSTVSVTVNALPVITSATASPESICVGAISDLVAVSIPAEAGQATVGTGTGTSSTNGITPFGPNYQSTRMQYIVRASELSAAGLAPGNITSLSFNVTSGITFPLVNYTVRMAHTAATDLGTAFLTPSFTNVFADASFVTGTSTGWRELTFSTPFNWDGTSNIVIEICHDNSTCEGGSGVCWSGNASVEVTTTAYNSVFGRYADPTNMCAVDGSGSAISTRTSRPNMRFNGQIGTNLTSGLNWSWNPGGFITSSVTVSPTTTTTYTVTATDPVTGCVSVSQDVTVTVAPVTAAASSNISTTCGGDPVELSVVAGGGGPFSYVWSDGTNTVGTAAEITVTPTTTTTYTVTVTDVCNNSTTDQVTITVNPVPMVSIEEVGPIDICAPGTQVLTANTTTPNPEYQWQNNGVDLDGETSSTLTVTATGNYSVVVTETSTGCVGSSLAVAVNINPLPVITSVTPDSEICLGSSVELVAASSFIVDGTTDLGTSTTTNSSTGISPFSAGYEGARTQYLIRASELQAINLMAGDISALSFFVTSGYNYTLNGYTVKMAHTSATELGTAFEAASFSTVFGPTAYNPTNTSNAWRTLDFDTPFDWDGTSNIIVEICFENDPDGTCGSCYSTTSSVRASTTPFNSVYGRYLDNGPACDEATPGTASSTRTTRPNMRFNGNVLMNYTADYSWNWTPGNLAGSTVTVTPTATTTYTVVATNETTGCSSIPSSVTVTVKPAPSITVEAAGPTTFCAPGSVTLTSTTNAVNATFQWLKDGVELDGETGTTLVVSESGNYSIVVTEEETSDCPVTSTAVSVTVNPQTGPIVFNNPTPVVCEGSSITLTASTGASGSGIIGTGTVSNTLSTPYKGNWGANRSQFLYTAAELTALGMVAGSNISAIGMDITSFTSPYTFNDFTIKMKNTSNNVLTSALETGLTTVFGPTNFTLNGTVTFATNHVLTNKFMWDGVSNIIVEFCFNNVNSGGGAAKSANVRSTTVTGHAAYLSQDNNATTCSNTSAATVSSSRVNMRFTYAPDEAFTWSPSTGLNTTTGNTVIASPAATQTYTVTSTTYLGCTRQEEITVEVSPALTVSSDIVGPTNATAYTTGLSLATYTIATTNETSIVWNIPAGSTNVTGQGTNTISFNYPNTFFGGNISVTVEGNAPCEPITRTLAIGYDCPAAPVVSGPVNICQYVGNGSLVTYTVTPDDGIASYVWSVPNNVTIVSGQGTTSLTVQFENGFITQSGKRINVYGVSGCGNTAQTIYYLHAQYPSSAQPISGPTDICNYVGTSDVATYTITDVAGADNYLWTVPAGATIVSGQGTTSIGVTFDNSFATSGITVYALNSCGTSTPRTLIVKRTSPSTPSPISGPTSVCGFMPNPSNPAGLEATYSVSAAANVNYVWSVPSGASITGGQGTNSITVLFDNTYTTGGISVYASSSCGVSATRNLNLSRLNPSAPSVIDVTELGGCPERMVEYSLSLGVPGGATWVEWTVPAGATIMSGQGTSTIVVSYSSAAVAGEVTATGVNGCGTSSSRKLKVKLAACETDNVPMVKGDIGTEVKGLTLDVNVFPNPSTDLFNILAKSSDNKTRMVVKIMDNLGRVMESHNMQSGETLQAGRRLKAGSYFVEVMQGKERVTKKVIKF